MLYDSIILRSGFDSSFINEDNRSKINKEKKFISLIQAPLISFYFLQLYRV